MEKKSEKQPYMRERSKAFPNKEQTLDFIGKIYDMGWIDKKTYKICLYKLGESCEDEERIDNLDLSVRAYNCLLRSEIYTLNQLRFILLGNRHPINNRDLFEIRNLGVQTAIEIMQAAIDNGVILPEEIGTSSNIFHNCSKWEMCRKEFLK